MVGLSLCVIEVHRQISVLLVSCQCYCFRLQLYLRSCSRSFLLVAASLVLLRSRCLLLGYSGLNIILLSLVVLRAHRLSVKIIFIPDAPVLSAAVSSTLYLVVSFLLIVV